MARDWWAENAPESTVTSPAGQGGASPAVQPNQQVGNAVNSPGGSQDYAAIIKELQGQFPPTPQGFQQLLKALNDRGIPAMAASHGGGTLASDDKIVLPNGTYYDIRTDNDWVAPGTALHWDPSVPVFDANGQSQNYNDVLKQRGLPTFAFTPTAADGPSFGGPGGQGGGGSLGDYGPLLQPYDKTFSAPTGTDDPGFQFALQNGINAIQHSPAAKGTLLTGGAMKDLVDYVTGASLQDYAGAYNRAKTTFDTNYNVDRNNKLDPYNMLSGLTATGLNAAESANAGNAAYGTNLANLATGQGNVNAGRTAGNFNAWSGVPANLADLVNTYLNRPKQGTA